MIATHTAAVDARTKELAALREGPEATKKQIEALERERSAAVQERDLAAREVAAREAALASFSTGTLLGEFLDDRADADGYRKNLTIFTQVRNDFERLSRLMERATREYYDDKKPAPPVSRIVLYIDDLDRCPEDKVIEVLRTVHLLLAFPLFVCVVAVDPRWVTACLWKAPGLVDRSDPASHPTRDKAQLLDRTFGKPATPADFLEKIFQIPLWLRPVPPTKRSEIVRALLDPGFKARRSPEDAPATIAAFAPVADEASAVEALAKSMAPAPRTSAGAAKTGIPVPPADMSIDVVELDYLEQLGGLLDGNPRALKRFVNTYRLVKSALSDLELSVFRTDTRVIAGDDASPRYHPYRMCMAQLAVLCTQRERALNMVELADRTAEATPLGAWFDNLAKTGDRPLAECFRKALKDTDLEKVTFATFSRWLERTRRYSFYL
jgi:hypothetical protein